MITCVLPSFIIAVLLAFANAIFHPFVHDDIPFIVFNPGISHFDHLGSLFVQTVDPSGLQGVNVFYRPILEIFYRLEYRLFGLNPAGFHAVNIIIHLLNGILFWNLLRRLGFSGLVSYFAGLLFLIHPVQTEAVDAIVGISNLLSTFFILLTLNFYVEDNLILSLVFCVLAFFTKEQVVMMPLWLVLLDWYRREGGNGCGGCFLPL